MRTITPATLDDAATIAAAIYQLRIIRRELREAGATTAAKAVARACKSVEGANRHVQHRLRRSVDQRTNSNNAAAFDPKQRHSRALG